MTALSKSGVDKLGDRLREGLADESDVELLATWSNSFESSLAEVLDGWPPQGIEVSSRTKTSQSTVEKLRRQTRTRLSQVQDIVGCRVTLSDVPAQDRCLADLVSRHPGARLVDHRATPSHGYRAVHVIVSAREKPVEIQVRTGLQHVWAQLSEAFAGQFGQGIKYGVGEPSALASLQHLSSVIAVAESHGRAWTDYAPLPWYELSNASQRRGWRRTQRPKSYDLTLGTLVHNLQKFGALP